MFFSASPLGIGYRIAPQTDRLRASRCRQSDSNECVDERAATFLDIWGVAGGEKVTKRRFLGVYTCSLRCFFYFDGLLGRIFTWGAELGIEMHSIQDHPLADLETWNSMKNTI